jgi:hypothetical protein
MDIGRNDQCHCGSAKKYKNCHYQIDAANRASQIISSTSGDKADAAAELEEIIGVSLDHLQRVITQHSLNVQIKAKGYAQLAASFFGAMGHGEAKAIVNLVQADLHQQALVNYRCLIEHWTKGHYYSEYPDRAEKFVSSLPTERGRLAFLHGHRLKKPLRQKIEAEAVAARAERPELATWEEPGVEEAG